MPNDKEKNGRRKVMARAKKTTEAVNTEEVKTEEIVAEEVKEEPKKAKTRSTKTTAKPVELETADQRDIEIENLKAQIEQMKQLMAEQAARPQQIVVTQDNSERVWFRWMADVSDDNTVYIGENGQFGRIVGKTGTTYVPKNELSRVLDSSIRYYLEHRWLIVISGLNEEEREALGVNYKPGELLDENAFRKLAELGEELIEIYPALCDAHKEMVASFLHEAYEDGKRVDRNVIVELNQIHSDPALIDIIEQMNAKDADRNKKQK